MEYRYNNYYPDRFWLKDGVMELGLGRSIGIINVTPIDFV